MSPKERLKILLVEDDPFLIDIYVTKLKNEGFEVVVAVNGEEAVEKFLDTFPHLILLDIVLPNHDGWEVLQQIRNHSKEVKIIILSNLSQREEIEKGLKLGADMYLIKSQYTPSEVVAKIKQILNI